LTHSPENEFSVLRYETSDVFPGPRLSLSRSNELPTFRTLYLVADLEADPLTNASREWTSRELWSAFLEAHVLDVAQDAHPGKIAALLELARTFQIRDRVRLLRRLLDANPTTEIARYLHEAGDPGGLDFLRREISSGVAERQLRAATVMCDLGLAEGAESLLRTFRGNPAQMLRFRYQVVNALDRYLRTVDTDEPTKRAVLDFFFTQLSDPLVQSRAFTVVERETGQDFGYKAARGIRTAAERRTALQAATKKARAWWTAARSDPDFSP
jgi:hypothetical protein